VGQKVVTVSMPATLPNADQLSKFFHSRSQALSLLKVWLAM